MRRLIPILLVLALGCSDDRSTAPQSSSAASLPAGASWRTVQRVVDGDTLVLDGGERVRLIGVDTPETVHPRKPVEYFGREASSFTKRMVEGKKIWLEYDQTRKDKYKRTLAYVHMEDGRILNEEIVRQGYGHAYTRFPFKYMERYRGMERQAREAGAGLWGSGQSGSGIPVAPPRSVDRSEAAGTAPTTETVYVTRTGGKYHRAGCRYLARSKIPMKLEEAQDQYEPCPVCRPYPMVHERRWSAFETAALLMVIAGLACAGWASTGDSLGALIWAGLGVTLLGCLLGWVGFRRRSRKRNQSRRKKRSRNDRTG